ncbi:glycosyltransferase family 8 protein [Periconia macrospinosa]|uniref:glycogenin glucosyltransferase n=1 Tax=Periconia macrospinosa TaxID=97972 RepID=A0A2V1DI21_9PLEO|nr:glycosyltransferase family 8 protein [Periconia macrospinosa]
MARQLEDVYCTLLMSDSYLPGAIVLAHSLRDAGTNKKLAALITLDSLSADTITELRTLYDYLIPVERIRNPSPANLYLMGRPDLVYCFTKIALWRQTQFRKIVYLDADVVALRNLDELFDIDAPFAAAPDIGWPDAFNTGVMVLSPDMGEYWALHTMASAGDSFDGADQGLLNQYYEHKNWHRLKFTYNCTPNAQYQWEPAYRYYKRDISAVHFIGKDKPWKNGRKSSGGYGVHNELLARWWAVYDKHLKQASAPSTSQPESGHGNLSTTVVQQHAQGETKSADASTASPQPSIPSEPQPPVSQPPVPEVVVEPEISAEQPFSEPGEAAENIDQGVIEPTPTAEQRRFSAPQMEWDATKFEPPTDAKPEAANFPTETYVFSQSHELFNAPQSYPEPPKDMWYEVPEEKPKPAEKPKPIFPWEQQHDRPKATRVFAEDLPPAPEPEPAPSPLHTFSTVHYEEAPERTAVPGLSSPERVSSPKNADESWQAFQENSSNAWDSVPGIDTYVRAIFENQARRGQTQVLTHPDSDDVGSPTLERKNRRASLLITDFPSAVERPSLPVTPAPVRRPTFWGEERNDQGELPQAEGVPPQAEWVCPNCGFSSVNASDFHRRRSVPATSLPTITTSAAQPVQKSPQEPTKASQSPEPVQTKPQKISLEKAAPPPPKPSTPPYRAGISSRGAPLASLSDPSLFIHPAPASTATESSLASKFDSAPVTTSVSTALSDAIAAK